MARIHKIEITLSPDEKTALRDAVKGTGLSIAAWARSTLLRAARKEGGE